MIAVRCNKLRNIHQVGGISCVPGSGGNFHMDLARAFCLRPRGALLLSAVAGRFGSDDSPRLLTTPRASFRSTGGHPCRWKLLLSCGTRRPLGDD